MAKRSAARKSTPARKTAPKTTRARKAKTSKASATRKAAAKKAARRKALEAAKAAEETAATTLAYTPPPFEPVADPSKAPGKQHRHPPMSIPGVKHSESYIAKARTPFNRRQNIGR